MSNDLSQLLEAATTYLQQQRSYSVSRLQQRFALGYSDALQLQQALVEHKVIEEPNPLGLFHVATAVLSKMPDETDQLIIHATALRNLALYMIEHDGFQNTEAMSLLAKPYQSKGHHPSLRAMTKECLSTDEDPLFSLACGIAKHQKMVGPFSLEALMPPLTELCSQVTISMPDRSNALEMRINNLTHAMRYLHLNKKLDRIETHSRVFHTFIHPDLLPKLKSLHLLQGTEIHNEHIVPCAFLRNKALELLIHGIPPEDVAQWIEPYYQVAVISKEDSDALDGPMKLRDKMPEGWLFGKGCTYERLHLRNISLDLPEESTPCICSK